MALKLNYPYLPSASLGFSVKRKADGFFWAFTGGSAGTFVSSPATADRIASLTEGASPYLGSYTATIASTPTNQWTDGDYIVHVHDTASANLVVDELTVAMFDGDDVTLRPTGATAAQIDTQLTSTHGSGAWTTATGFATSTDVTTILAAIAAIPSSALDAYTKAVLRGKVVVGPDGSYTFYDADTPATARVRFNPVAAPGGRTITLDP